MKPNEKTCGNPKCRKLYSTAVIGGLRAFDPHQARRDGVQPFCRLCDWSAKHEPHRGWARLRADKRGIAIEITEAQYKQIIHANRCYWCKGRLFDWGGYWIDRRDNRGNYSPGNVVACCQWCNRYKNDLPEAAWRAMLDGLLAKFGTGPAHDRHLDWSLVDDRYKSTRPDLSRFEISNTKQLSLTA